MNDDKARAELYQQLWTDELKRRERAKTFAMMLIALTEDLTSTEAKLTYEIATELKQLTTTQ